MFCKLIDHLVFRHWLFGLSPPLAYIVMRKPCKNEQCIFKELGSKNLAEKVESLLKLIADSRFGRVHNDRKRIDVFGTFQTNNHFSDVFRVSTLCVSNSRSVDDYDGLFSRLIKPSGQYTIKCSSFWLSASRNAELFFAAQRVCRRRFATPRKTNQTDNFELLLFFFFASFDCRFEFPPEVIRCLGDSI